jgi:protein phosphatase
MQPAARSRVRIEFAQASDPGRDPNKQVNEDSCGYAETKFGHLCVLCDGMGGHYGGKEASRLAITTIFEVIDQTPTTSTPALALKAAVEEAGRRVYRLGGPPENRTRPGSTAVAMLLHDRGVDVAHVGDSRAYVVRSQQIYPLTRDHSMVQGMIDAGMITEAQAIGHPDANKITRALGMKPEVEVEVRPEPMELFPGDILLLTSDGLTDLALNNDILAALRQALGAGAVSHACTELIRMANERGGHDNITVQIARVLEVAPKVSTTIPQAPSAAHEGGAQAAVAPQPSAKTGTPQAPVGVTSPDAAIGAPSHTGAPVSSGQPMVREVQWAPVPPTATDAMPAPTIVEPPPTSQGWGSGQYQGPTSANIAAYRVDGGAKALPLPPPAGAPQAGPGVTVMAAAGPTPTMTPTPAPLPAHDDPRGWQMSQLPSSISFPGGQPSRGGIVFVVIGMSAAIAVLIVLLIWALLLR